MSDENNESPIPLPDAVSGGAQAAGTRAPARGLLKVLLLGPRAWKHWWIALVRTVGHEDVLEKAGEDASFSFNYAFMVAISSGIATLGLLLNSPAVIIGAMLISPLMGPIVSSGFAITGFNVEMGKRSARTLLYGGVAAVAFAATIVALSPVRELTPEILARTRPNLFDLAVAILSGAAGGYAMIRGRGGAIVGVAIATALMPPLAVVGYGLATWQWPVARGALLLFITNMVAISLAVAALAEWYGFGRGGLRKRFAMQAMIALLVLAPLSVPLYLSLKSIAWESRVHTTVRSVLEAAARRLKQGQLAQLSVRFREGAPPSVDAILVSEESQLGLGEQLRTELKDALGAPVNLNLTQLHADDPEKLKAELDDVQPKVKAISEDYGMAAALRNEVPLPLAAVEVNSERRTAVLVPALQPDVGLGAWQHMEGILAGRYPDWQVTLVPPATVIPEVDFEAGSNSLAAGSDETLAVVAWALERWGVREVNLVAHVYNQKNRSLDLAKQRVALIGKWFAEHEISVQVHIDQFGTGKTIRSDGMADAVSTVEIVLPSDLPKPRSGA
ncbi:MAG: TIGR00341 family protein [Parasulfuritortus sp.]|nr:TIGR00341 family protein [Parasulfuritortus sp.]